MEGYLIWIVTSILVGIVSAWVAKSKGKDPVLWFAIGAALNVFVLLVIAGLQKRQRRV